MPSYPSVTAVDKLLVIQTPAPAGPDVPAAWLFCQELWMLCEVDVGTAIKRQARCVNGMYRCTATLPEMTPVTGATRAVPATVDNKVSESDVAKVAAVTVSVPETVAAV